MPSAPIDAVITELPPESTPPPEEEPPPPPPPPDEPTEFTIEEPTPPPRPPQAPPPKPRPKVAQNKGTGYSGVPNYSSAKSNWRSAPRPSYPYEARRAKQTGSGRFFITLTTAAMQRTSQPARARGARFSIRLRSTRSCAGSVIRARITRLRANHLHDARRPTLNELAAMRVTSPVPKKSPHRDHSADRYHVLPPGQFHDGEPEPGAHEGHSREPAGDRSRRTQPVPTPDPRDRLSLFVDPDGLVHFDKEVVPDGDVMPRLARAFQGESQSKALH
jgi:hypothetical protein